MDALIFVINPGSTSTKAALFKGRTCIMEETLRHEPADLRRFPDAASQLGYRLDAVLGFAGRLQGGLDAVDVFAGRGGLLRPLQGGTYLVDREMLDDLKASRYGDHASNLGALIAHDLAVRCGRAAYVVNPPVVDELMDEARYTGLPQIRRNSVFHALNHKAVAKRAALEKGMRYEDCNLIVAHLGGGISVGAHLKGRVVDVNDGLEEGPFSPERAGSLPVLKLMELCYSGVSKAEMKRRLVGEGGLYAYTGTFDCVLIENMAKKDPGVKKLLDAMAYRISREICACAAALCGTADCIVITGGLARSSYLTGEIIKRTAFLGSIKVFPGEDEMASLAEGVLDVMEGREKALVYGRGDAGDTTYL